MNDFVFFFFNLLIGTTPKSIENTWKHEKLMNLYFNMSIPNEDTAYLASAILRLYRIPHENITHKTLEINNNNNNESNDDKLMRITIYWYVRQSKKNKGNYYFRKRNNF